MESLRIGVAMLLLTAICLGCASCDTKATSNGTPVTVTAPSSADKGTTDEYWQNALAEVYKSHLELVAQHKAELQKGIHLSKLMHGNLKRKQIALTFDDGPHPQYTPQLLALLKKYNVRATFFLVGEKAEATPDLVKAELAAGHAVGNHTYHHVNLTKIPPRMVAAEIKACGDVLEHITGQTPHLFRPPGGDYNLAVAETATSLGYTLCLWTDDPGDYASPGAHTIESRLLKKVGNGGIVLIHDGVTQTLQILPQFIETMKSRGYEFVTCDEMLKNK